MMALSVPVRHRNLFRLRLPGCSHPAACYTLLPMASKDKGRKEVKKKPKPKPKVEPRRREEWISAAKPPAQS